jgi:hypothetical protein
VRDTNGLQTNITLSADGDGARSATEHRRGQAQIRLVGEVVYGTAVGSAAVVGEVGHGFDPELVSIHRVDDQSSFVEIGLEDGRERMSLAWQGRRHVWSKGCGVNGPPIAIHGTAFAPRVDRDLVAADLDFQGRDAVRTGINVLPLPLKLTDRGVSRARQGHHEDADSEPGTFPNHRSLSSPQE